MKKRLLISVSNNFVYDRRMQRIAHELNKSFEVVVFAVRKDEKAISKATYDYDVHYAKLPFQKGILFYLFLNIYLFFFLIKSRFDAVYAVDLDTLGSAALAKVLMKNKLVFDSHEYFSEVPELNGKKLKKKIWKSVGHFGTRRTDLCFTVNKPLADILEEVYHTPFQVLRNMPFRLKNQKSSISKEDNIILYQGAVNKGRGLQEAIQAMQQLPQYTLVIVGEGDLFLNLKDLVNQLNLSNVVFTGYILPDELNKYTQKAKIGLNLIVSYSLNYYYSLANKFFDYVQCGVPSINMNYPVYAALNQEFEVSVLIDSLEVQQIVDAVRSLEDSSYYKSLQSACEKAANQWNWENERSALTQVSDLFD